MSKEKHLQPFSCLQAITRSLGNPASLPQWMKVYASRVADEYTKVSGKNDAGVVDANSYTANAPKGGFSYDLTAWLSGAGQFSNATPAILAGWPEIDGGGEKDTPQGGGNPYSSCNLVNGTSCPAGKVAVVGMWSCGNGTSSDPKYPPPSASLPWVDSPYYSVPNTNFVFYEGQETRITGTYTPQKCGPQRDPCGDGKIRSKFGQTFLNGTLQISEVLCYSERDSCDQNFNPSICRRVYSRSVATQNRVWCCTPN